MKGCRSRRELLIENRQLRAQLDAELAKRNDLEQELTETIEDLGEVHLLLDEQTKAMDALRSECERQQAAGR